MLGESCEGSMFMGVRVIWWQEASHASMAAWERLPVVGLKWEVQG